MSANTQVAPGIALTGLARALVQEGKLRPDRAQAMARKAAQSNTQFIDELLGAPGTEGLSALDIARFASETFGHPLLDLDAISAESLPKDVIDKKLIASLRVLALNKRGGKLALAMSDPTNIQALDRVKFQTQLTPQIVVVEHNKLLGLLQSFTQSAAQKLDDLVGADFNMDDLLVDAGDEQAQEEAGGDVDDAPVVRFLQKLLLDAINEGASDLHFEPYEKFYRVRFRVDGQLHEVAQPPLAIRDRLAARVKVISRMDISEKRVPQDGRLKIAFGPQRAIDLRVSTLPTLFGEKIVMRVLDSAQARIGVDALGFEPEQKAALLDAIHQPWGMVLVTGPTGSGKTVTLYSCLAILNQPDVNIATAEDPVEIQLAGINQVNINEKAGLTFANALRAFLRQDPDIVMVGEVRDLETADIAIKAAQTGHLVLSTLHTNDAPTAVTRLVNIGVAPHNIVSSVILVVAQRLARRLCACKRPAESAKDVLLGAGFLEPELDGGWVPYKPVGCERCRGTGYKGRVGIFEMMPISAAMQDLMMSGASSARLARLAREEGVRDLRRSGLLKVRQGATSLEEVLGCTNG